MTPRACFDSFPEATLQKLRKNASVSARALDYALFERDVAREALAALMKDGTLVRCWPGLKGPNEPYYVANTTSPLSELCGTVGVYVRRPNGRSDFIALTHIEVVPRGGSHAEA